MSTSRTLKLKEIHLLTSRCDFKTIASMVCFQAAKVDTAGNVVYVSFNTNERASATFAVGEKSRKVCIRNLARKSTVAFCNRELQLYVL